MRKEKRNKGLECENKAGKLVQARKIGADCKCKNKSFDKVGLIISVIFDAFINFLIEKYILEVSNS